MIKETEKRYPITCPHCKKNLSAALSLGMELGFSLNGFGTCISCKQMFRLTYNPHTETMTTSIINERKE